MRISSLLMRFAPGSQASLFSISQDLQLSRSENLRST
ncbi:hypothetical protein SLEP1_g27237 [Rubroshorea leprosula]|uniref:Uncharacterized protein n=1 Tax=Rubroshorea leprosula TaxID=152421 RepID=A0AAV5JSJ7_9ROSI|nr:hypothetical protein SLEP1_g27237 [Rubroshorea leprosula]